MWVHVHVGGGGAGVSRVSVELSEDDLPPKAFNELSRPAGLVQGVPVSPHKHHHEQLGFGRASVGADGDSAAVPAGSIGAIGTTRAHVAGVTRWLVWCCQQLQAGVHQVAPYLHACSARILGMYLASRQAQPQHALLVLLVPAAAARHLGKPVTNLECFAALHCCCCAAACVLPVSCSAGGLRESGITLGGPTTTTTEPSDVSAVRDSGSPRSRGVLGAVKDVINKPKEFIQVGVDGDSCGQPDHKQPGWHPGGLLQGLLSEPSQVQCLLRGCCLHSVLQQFMHCAV